MLKITLCFSPVYQFNSVFLYQKIVVELTIFLSMSIELCFQKSRKRASGNSLFKN